MVPLHAAIGLPAGDIPIALLMFSMGVEIGQLAFVALTLVMVRAFRVLLVRWPAPSAMFPVYVVGCLGASWSIQRLVILFQGAS
jgi:hypothetical protein